jgi:hypothetical protein
MCVFVSGIKRGAIFGCRQLEQESLFGARGDNCAVMKPWRISSDKQTGFELQGRA